MKKLMFGLAIAAVGTAFAVESSNIVGYDTRASLYGGGATEYCIATFESVSTANKFTLGQLKPSDDWDYFAGDTIATIDDYGAQETYYTYESADECWYECDSAGNYYGESQNDVQLDINKGLIVYSASGDTEVTFSGAVVSGECEMYTEAGVTAYTGNFLPKTLSIGQIVPDGNWDYFAGDTLATVDQYGAQETYYTYEQGDGWYECDSAGNYYGDCVNDTVSFDAHQGLIVYSAAGASVTFPGL